MKPILGKWFKKCCIKKCYTDFPAAGLLTALYANVHCEPSRGAYTVEKSPNIFGQALLIYCKGHSIGPVCHRTHCKMQLRLYRQVISGFNINLLVIDHIWHFFHFWNEVTRDKYRWKWCGFTKSTALNHFVFYYLEGQPSGLTFQVFFRPVY